MAFFLKYRPQTFEDFVGQESVAKTLRNALKNKKETHAYLFSGSRGTGKTSTARIFAKGLICPHLTEGNPCGKCEFCTQITEGSLVDVIEIDGASNRGIDEIRELREKIAFAPNFADKKIYIIDEVHMLTTPAFNALLKTLEEPPSHAFFLLATTELHKLPETIISRCQTFIFHKFPREQLVKRLEYISEKENLKWEEKALQLIADKAEGGMRDAISLLEQIASETENNITEMAVIQSLGMAKTEQLEEFVESIVEKNCEKGLSLIQKIAKEGGDFRTFGHNLLNFLRSRMHETIIQKGDMCSILETIEEVEKALMRLKSSPITELPFEIAIVNLTQGKAEIQKPVAQMSAPTATIKQSPAPAPKKEELVVKTVVEEKKPELKTEVSGDKNSGFVFESDVTPTPTHTRTQQPIEPPKAEIKTETPATGATTSQITDRIKEIAEKSKIPSFAKMSLLATKANIKGDKITFECANEFHIQKLQENSETKVKIQNTITELFGQKYLVDFEFIKKEVLASVDDFSEYFS